jgi:MoaA/NifB/PqqE/SkfB family radical SAM enzyme
MVAQFAGVLFGAGRDPPEATTLVASVSPNEREIFVKKNEVVKAWGQILRGYPPAMSIEITRECPLRCPGCYAYEPGHLGTAGPLRSLTDFRGQALVDGVMTLVLEHRPLHVSIVGGEPLMRERELTQLLPKLNDLGIAVQVVTSAVKKIPDAWRDLPRLFLVVSIDGLQPEHDARRRPATYERILENIKGHSITVHNTITSQVSGKPGYLEEFVSFWSGRPEVKKLWFSLFTPQVGADDPEILTPENRLSLLAELAALRPRFPKIDLPEIMLQGYQTPPKSPEECIFSRTTVNFTADLKTRITPCQFGGTPDCSQCGCVASAGLNGVGDFRLFGLVPLRRIFSVSDRIGRAIRHQKSS